MKPELLAPAGNFDSLKAAIEAGADAVYLGGKQFGARHFAGNFDDQEIVEAISLAHMYHVKIYVTMNTLVYEEETSDFLNYVDFLYQNHVDALIIQDIGMMDLVHQTYPDLPLHASTQMHIHNVEGVKLLEEMGVTRVVLARELSLKEIRHIKKNTKMELEIFIHGALCFSYSGQCLMSSFVMQRSGNRGTCSQCCRLPYRFESDQKQTKSSYYFSMKDLCTLPIMDEICQLHVHSLKIEGRMKSSGYVYMVVKLYREAIDSYFQTGHASYSKENLEKLKVIFHRPYTTGFLTNTNPTEMLYIIRPNHQGTFLGKVCRVHFPFVDIKLENTLSCQDGIRILSKEDCGLTITKMQIRGKNVKEAKPKDIVTIKLEHEVFINDEVIKTTDFHLMESIQKEIQSHSRKVNISGIFHGHLHQPITLEIFDQGKKIAVQGSVPELSNHIVTDSFRIQKQLTRFGGTPYQFESLEIDTDDSIFIPIPILNDLRRKALLKLREEKKRSSKQIYQRQVPDFSVSFEKIVEIRDQKYPINKNQRFIVNDLSLLKEHDIYHLPVIMNSFKDYDCLLLASELGSIHYYRPSYIDHTLNVTNSYSIAFFHSLGVEKITLSYELSKKQIQKTIQEYQKRYHKNPCVECIISSRPIVMYNKALPFLDLKKGYFIDSKNHRFPVTKTEFGIQIAHSKIIEEESSFYQNIGVSSVRTIL